MKTFLRILLLLVVAAATAIAIFYAWTDWAGARHWKAVEAELLAKGEPLTIDEFVPKPIPDEMNFAAAPIFAEIQKVPGRSKWRISQIQRFTGGYRKGFWLLANAARSIDPKFSGSDADAARMILAQMGKWKPLLDEVREAARRPGTDWKLDYSSPLQMRVDYVSVLLNLAQTLSTEAKAYLELGDSESARADFDLILNLSNRAAVPPLMIGHLVRLAMVRIDIDVAKFGIERHAWTESQLEAIQRTFGHIALQSEVADSLRFERACVNGAMLGITRAAVGEFFSLAGESSAPSKLVRGLWELRPAGWANEDRCEYSESIQSIIRDVTASPLKLQQKSSPPTGIVSIFLRMWRTPFTSIALAPEKGTIQNTLYSQNLVSEVCTACAIERYRLAHGSLPPSLTALCPEFLSAIPLDPMSGQPLHYLPGSGDSYILYGVGWNQQDDGGSELNLEHQKVPSGSPDTLDWVWKIGNPS